MSRRLRDRGRAQHGFTLIEVLVAALVLVVGLLALLGMLEVASKTNHTNRVRQEATNVARELIENVRALPYTQLATPDSIAAALQPQLTPGATRSGSTLQVTRSIYSFTVTFTTCSMDDPNNGYGDHTSPPASGGNWCPDVAPSNTAQTAPFDSNPDDYKRVSVTVTPTGGGGSARTYPVQQTVGVYARAVNGPAVSCLTTVAGSCPGQNQPITLASVTAVTFNVTTTSLADKIEWLVNGNPPGSQDPLGANGTYTPSGTTSSFTWNIPTTTVGGSTYTVDGTYSITAVALDASGNSGTRSTLQITVNEHPVLASASFNAGFDQLIQGVDIQWVPSVDRDVLYYNVYHQIGGSSSQVLLACSHVTGTSCTDTSPGSIPVWPATTTCNNPPQSYPTTNVYWVIGVDNDQTGTPRASTFLSNTADANACDHQPSAPSSLTSSLSGGSLNVNWFAPTGSVDPDATANGDTIVAWRIYRWSPSQGSVPQTVVGNRLQLVGAGNGSPFVTSAADPSPDPGGTAQDYCVTSVDRHLNESPCSEVMQQ